MMDNRLEGNLLRVNDYSEKEKSEDKKSDWNAPSAPPVSVLTTRVEQAATSATFTIPRATTILSDDKPHKVTIAIIDLDPEFTYTTIPKIAQSAYLRATCINTSDFPFLPGKMNVFMDNTFISSSHIKRTNPKDELSLFLGVDGGIVVQFKEETFNETKGFVSKSKTTHYKHIINIKNTKNQEVQVSVFDQFPQSSEDKIKVQLVHPSLKDEGVTLNEFHNLRWILKIDSGKSHQIDYQYTVEYPASRDVTFTG
jgi:uncharacterized protein (TIGR02231 family)